MSTHFVVLHKDYGRLAGWFQFFQPEEATLTDRILAEKFYRSQWDPNRQPGEEGHSIHLPQPSYWPLILSIGILILAYGLIYSIAVAAIGALIGMISVYAWSFEPVNDPEETENSAH